jgi:hypothetical protein
MHLELQQAPLQHVDRDSPKLSASRIPFSDTKKVNLTTFKLYFVLVFLYVVLMRESTEMVERRGSQSAPPLLPLPRQTGPSFRKVNLNQ